MSTESTETTELSEDLVSTSTQTSVAEQEPLVVGANSVYKDVDALIEGKRQADAYISKLKAENQALFEKLKEQRNLNNFKGELSKMTEINDTVLTGTTTQLTEEQIRDIALKSFEQRQAEMSRNDSLQKANAALEAMYGSEANNKKETRAKELGMTVEQLDEMCVNAPKAFNKLMGIEEPTRVTMESLTASRNYVDTSRTNTADSRITQLITDPSFAKNKAAVKGLIDDALKNPSILAPISDWKLLVK